jgi:uncharacterized SAM-binding protein YcdF (DUF218 family)
MFFLVSKVFWLIAEPVGALVLIACVGVALAFTRWARIGRWLSTLAAFGLLIIVFTPIGSALLLPLENRFPPPPADLPAPTGIIVLGGGLEAAKSEARGQAILDTEGSRLTAGLELARRYPKARLIFTGGSGSLDEHAPSEANGAQRLWLDLGGNASQMSFEGKSRNTWENALFTRDLVQPKPGETWLLVTSAWHMPRAMGIFRRVGFKVIPYPVAYRTFADNRDWGVLVAGYDRILTLDLAVREWIGLVAYRLTHKTNALFPAP